MSKEIDWSETRKTLVNDDSSILSHIFMGKFAKEMNYEGEKEKAMLEADEWNLSMTVNGVTVDNIELEKFLKKMWALNYEILIRREAEKMMNKKWDEAFGNIKEFTQKAEEILSNKLSYDWELK